MVITQPSHLNTRPFANRTTFDHLNTGLVRHSDGYCTECIAQTSNYRTKACSFYGVQVKWLVEPYEYYRYEGEAPGFVCFPDHHSYSKEQILVTNLITIL